MFTLYLTNGHDARIVDKLADYEDELRRLRNERGPPTPPATAEPVAQAAPASTYTSRFGASLFGTRRPGPASANSDPPPTTAPIVPTVVAQPDPVLQAALAKEQQARQKAEGQLNQMSQEVEDLSVQLFQQANEMVASERKARAKLEERVELLEKRDVEKRKRLERLEGALKRIDRVRGLLAPPG